MNEKIFHCKCGAEMELVKHPGYQRLLMSSTTWWYECPKRKLYNFWLHEAPIYEFDERLEHHE